MCIKKSTQNRSATAKVLALLSGITTAILLTYAPIKADELRSDSYVIQFSNLNTTSGTKTSSSYNVTDTVGQTAAGPFGPGATYFVGAGFQYIYQIGTFSFQISDVSVELGEIVIGSHSTATNTLTVSAKGAGGYTVYAYETHPMQHTNGTDTIADTTCDASNCDETTAGVWSNEAITGFGFNLTGDDIASDFTDSTYFRQFADNSSAETTQSIMSSTDVVSNSVATVTYKIGASSTDVAGNYETQIIYIAVPAF